MTADTPTPTPPSLRWPVAAAAVLHLGIAVYPLPATGLVAPAWYLAVVAVVWIAGAVLIWRLASSAPRRAWLVPVGLLVLWSVGITVGERLLGWTA